MLGGIHAVSVTDGDVARLKTAMATMPAHPDVAPALTELRANGFRLVTLTNSPHTQGVPTPLSTSPPATRRGASEPPRTSPTRYCSR
ncbi:MAG: hypothetical protein ACLPXZ_09015 [Mycobacterium sp.]